MRESWETAKAWTDALLPDVRRHLAEQLISVGTEVEDLRENTDLRVLCGRDHRIAVRLRTADVFRRWPDNITYRWAVRSGATTEFAKMMSGWGDLFFYGFADDHRSRRPRASAALPLRLRLTAPRLPLSLSRC